MFSSAVRIASEYTLPVIASRRLFDGTVQCGAGTFVVLNRDGWIVTALHVLQNAFQAQKDEQEQKAYELEKQAILADQNLSANLRRKRLARLYPNSEWIVTHSFWWGISGDQTPVRVDTCYTDAAADLAVGKLEPFDPNWVKSYPVLRNPIREMQAGTSLCRLGFPFHQIASTYDERTGGFSLAPGVLPMPRFPNDGIHTRMLIRIDPNTNRQVKFVETSTPGLRGQSGGPVFDVGGEIWGIQSHTMHLPLGFTPTAKVGNRETVEHQFMHVGLASHVEELIRLLDQHGIQYKVGAE